MFWSKSNDFTMPIVFNIEPENLGGFSPQSTPGVYTHASFLVACMLLVDTFLVASLAISDHGMSYLTP